MRTTVHHDIALLIARIGLGVIFVAHGWQKVNDYGHAAVTASFEGMGVPMPGLSAYYAAYVELIGGVLLIAGALTPIVGLLLFLDMAGAFFIVHLENGVFATNGGYELVLALGVGSLVLAAVGPGKFSADKLLISGVTGKRARASA